MGRYNDSCPYDLAKIKPSNFKVLAVLVKKKIKTKKQKKSILIKQNKKINEQIKIVHRYGTQTILYSNQFRVFGISCPSPQTIIISLF